MAGSQAPAPSGQCRWNFKRVSLANRMYDPASAGQSGNQLAAFIERKLADSSTVDAVTFSYTKVRREPEVGGLVVENRPDQNHSTTAALLDFMCGNFDFTQKRLGSEVNQDRLLVHNLLVTDADDLLKVLDGPLLPNYVAQLSPSILLLHA